MVFSIVSSVGDDVKWQSAIERALSTWESVVEWADYISFLARVQKAAKNKQRCDGSQLPLAPQISEMLSMCLDPSLPAGVHQMCIDVYDTVFTILGPEKLSETINIWLPGLLPVVSWSAFNVKPHVLEVFQKHVIPAVKPHPTEFREVYRPLLLSLLPSIEDESVDCFAEIMQLLNTLRTHSFGDSGEFFWRCFYLTVITSPDSRLGSLTYLNKNSPYLDETGFLVRAVCCGLEDANVLVQRGFLDMLAKHLPLDSKLLQNHPDDFDKVIYSACRTILRKDMSLNRRLRLWLLGPDPDSSLASTSNDGMSRLEYLNKYGAERLKTVMLQELERDPVTTCLIAQGLTDRWELGAVLAPALLTPILLDSRKMGNVPKAFKIFFDNIESSVVWSTAIELLDVDQEAVMFMIQNYDITDEEMLKTHIPLFILYILSGKLTECESDIVAELLKILPPIDLPVAPESTKDVNFRESVPKYLKESFELGIKGEACESPVENSKNVSWYLADLAASVVVNGGSATILNLVLELIPETPGLALEIPQSEKLISLLNADSEGGVELFSHLKSSMSPLQIMKYVKSLVDDACENFLNDGYKQVERVQDLWNVNDVLGGSIVSSALSRVMADKSRSAFDRARIYVGIWSYSVDKHDIFAMLTKPTLLFLDIAYEDKSLFGAYLQSGVVSTGTSTRFVKLLVDKLDSEACEDDAVLSYILERFIVVLSNQEIKSAYISRFAPIVSTLILEWFDKNMLTRAAYSHALELAEITVLDRRIKDGKVWLRRFSDALISSYIKDYDGDEKFSLQKQQQQKQPKSSHDQDQGQEQQHTAQVSGSVPVSLMKFITAAVPLLEQQDDIRLFAEVCVRNLESEVDYEGYGQLLHALLQSSSMVEEDLLHCIVSKLSQLEEPLLSSTLDGIGTNTGILHLLSAIESIIMSGIKCVREHNQHSQPTTGGLTSAIAGFHLESPEDRSLAVESEIMLGRCIQMAIQQSCKYWLFLQRTRDASFNTKSITTAIHTTGRLKTRLRKLMFICYTAQPSETLTGVVANIADPAKSVRMVHMFEGSRQKITLDLLFELALGDTEMFDVTASYIDSLELDILTDIWPQLQGFLTMASQSNSAANNSKALKFIVNSVVPRLDKIRIKNNKKLVKEFSDTFSRLLLNTDANNDSMVLYKAVEELPSIISEQESQAQLLNKILSTLFKNPRDIAKYTALLQKVSTTFSVAGTPPAKVWARFVGDFMLELRSEEQVIPLNLGQSIEMMPVVNSWLSCDKERVRDFVAKVATYGASNVLFGWTGTQAVADANLRRLAYMTISSSPSTLVLNLSKLTNQLAALWTQNATAVLFLLRACVLNDLSATLMSFMTFKLQAVFRDALKRTEPMNANEAKVLLEACKVVDLALTVNLEQFQPFEWLFISDNGDIVHDHGSAEHSTDDNKKESSSRPAKAGGVLEKLKNSPVIPQTVYQQLETPAVPYRGKRRPLLPKRAQISDLSAFLSRVSIAEYEDVYAVAEPDIEYCREWVLSDLFPDETSASK